MVNLSLLMSGSCFAGYSRLSSVPLTDVFEYGQCRADQQTQLTFDKRPADTSGRYYEASVGAACNILSSEIFALDGGIDLYQSHFHRSENFVEMVQGFLQISVYKLRTNDWSVYGGMHSFGVGNNANYNVGYLMVAHQSGSYQAGVGAYAGNGRLLIDGTGKQDAQGAMGYLQKRWSRSRASLEYLAGKNRFGFLWAGYQVDYSPTIQFTFSYGLAGDREHMRDWLLLRTGLSF